jgi:putative salt-induced outer membrane protein
MRKAQILFVLMATLFCTGLYADQVALKNGDRLTGTILKSDAKTLIIKTESAGDVTVLWSAIDSVSSTQPLHVGLNGGQMMVGPVTTSDGQIQIATQTAGVVTTAKDSIQTIRSDSEQAAYDAAIARLQHPHLGDFWTGVLDTGLSLTRGNSATLTYTLSGKAVRQTERDKITVYTTAIYGKNDNTSPSQTTAHQIQGGVRGDVNFGERWFGFAFTDFNYNELQHLDLQNVIAGGVGYHLIKTNKTTFDLFGGAGYNQEYFSSYSLPNPTPPPPALLFAAVTQRNAEIVLGEELNTKVNSRTTFSENFTFFPGLGGAGGYRFTFNTTAATKLKNWLAWQVTFADNYISNPPFGIKGNDLLLSTGLRLTFGTPK